MWCVWDIRWLKRIVRRLAGYVWCILYPFATACCESLLGSPSSKIQLNSLEVNTVILLFFGVINLSVKCELITLCAQLQLWIMSGSLVLQGLLGDLRFFLAEDVTKGVEFHSINCSLKSGWIQSRCILIYIAVNKTMTTISVNRSLKQDIPTKRNENWLPSSWLNLYTVEIEYNHAIWKSLDAAEVHKGV